MRTSRGIKLVLVLRGNALVHPLPRSKDIRPISSAGVRTRLLCGHVPFDGLLFVFGLAIKVLTFFHLLCHNLHHSSTLSSFSNEVMTLSFSSHLTSAFFPFSLCTTFLFRLFKCNLE